MSECVAIYRYRADKLGILEIQVILILVHTMNNPFLTLVLNLGGIPKFSPQTPKLEPSENVVFRDFDLVARV